MIAALFALKLAADTHAGEPPWWVVTMAATDISDCDPARVDLVLVDENGAEVAESTATVPHALSGRVVSYWSTPRLVPGSYGIEATLRGCDGEDQASHRIESRVTPRVMVTAVFLVHTRRPHVEESPGDDLACVQEVVDDSSCYGPKDGSYCPLTVRVVDFLAGEPGRPPERGAGWTYDVMEMRMEEPWPNRTIGRRRLVISVPTNVPGLYGNALFILDPTEEDVRTLRQILDAVRVRRSSNDRPNSQGGYRSRVAGQAAFPGTAAG